MKTTVTVLLSTLLLAAVGTAGAQNVEYTGSTLWSDVRDVEVVDTLAYCAFVNGLVILDVTVTENPIFVSQYYLEGEGLSIDVEGNYAYLADGSSGLQIIDVSDPSQPLWAAQCYSDTIEVHDVFVSGNYAYVVYGHCFGVRPPECVGFLRIFDISNPANPILLGSHVMGASADHVFVSGNYAYVAGNISGWEIYSGQLQVIDISDPTNPIPMGSIQGIHISSIYVQGSYAYVAFGSQGLEIIDISEPTDPTSVGIYQDVWAEDVFIRDEYAYVAAYGYGLKILDIDNPSNPFLVGGYETSGYARDVFVVGNFAYIANLSGIFIIDINDPAEPSLIGNFATPSFVNNVFASDNNACVSASSGVEIIDINDLSEPIWVGGYWTPDFRDMSITGQYLFLLESSYLMIFDISAPSDPILIDVSNPGDGLRGLFISGDYAYLADLYSGLITLDISDPTDPHPASECNLQDFCNSVFVIDNIALLTGYFYLHVVDVSDPYDPAEMASIETDDARKVFISGEYAYVKVWCGLLIIDITDPLHPELAGSYDDCYIEDFFVSGDLVFVARSFGGVQIIDVSDPVDPVFVAGYNTPGETYDVFVEDPYIFLADHISFMVLRFNPETGIIEEVSTPAQFSLSQNYPNPFNASTSISFALPEAGDVRLIVYDLLGRQVCTLLDDYRPAGTHRVTFDASALGSGIYFYRVCAGDMVESKRMLLLK